MLPDNFFHIRAVFSVLDHFGTDLPAGDFQISHLFILRFIIHFPSIKHRFLQSEHFMHCPTFLILRKIMNILISLIHLKLIQEQMRLQTLLYLLLTINFPPRPLIPFLPPHSFILFPISRSVFIFDEILLFSRFHEAGESVEPVGFGYEVVVDVGEHVVYFGFWGEHVVIALFPLSLPILLPLSLLNPRLQM